MGFRVAVLHLHVALLQRRFHQCDRLVAIRFLRTSRVLSPGRSRGGRTSNATECKEDDAVLFGDIQLELAGVEAVFHHSLVEGMARALKVVQVALGLGGIRTEIYDPMIARLGLWTFAPLALTFRCGVVDGENVGLCWMCVRA